MFVFPQRRAYEGRLPRRPVESQAGELTPVEVSRASVWHNVLVTEGEAGIRRSSLKPGSYSGLAVRLVQGKLELGLWAL